MKQSYIDKKVAEFKGLIDDLLVDVEGGFGELDGKIKLESFLFSSLAECWDKSRLDARVKIENWLYSYDNYITMMKTKKSFEKGDMARELAKELMNILSKPLQAKE